MWHLFCRNAYAGILHGNGSIGGHRYADPTVVGGKLKCVGNEIGHDFFHFIPIKKADHGRFRQDYLQVYQLFIGHTFK